MKTRPILAAVLACSLVISWAHAGTPPRSAQQMKDNGNDFLAAKRYADAVDSYLQAVQIFPDFGEAHYNLGVALLKGYKAYSQARFHFEKYLEVTPGASDRQEVQTLISSLAGRVRTTTSQYRTVIGMVGGRLLVGGGNWVRVGEQIEISEPGKDPCACLYAEYVYPDSVLTQRVWDDKTLDVLKVGLLAASSAP